MGQTVAAETPKASVADFECLKGASTVEDTFEAGVLNPTKWIQDGYEYDTDFQVESQRGWFFCGFALFSPDSLLPADPRPFTSLSGEPLGGRLDSLQVPNDSWEWYWQTWYADMSGDVDDQGWIYSWRFRSKHWHGRHLPLRSFVRQRRWRRVRRRPLHPMFEDQPEEAKPAPETMKLPTIVVCARPSSLDQPHRKGNHKHSYKSGHERNCKKGRSCDTEKYREGRASSDNSQSGRSKSEQARSERLSSEWLSDRQSDRQSEDQDDKLFGRNSSEHGSRNSSHVRISADQLLPFLSLVDTSGGSSFARSKSALKRGAERGAERGAAIGRFAKNEITAAALAAAAAATGSGGRMSQGDDSDSDDRILDYYNNNNSNNNNNNISATGGFGPTRKAANKRNAKDAKRGLDALRRERQRPQTAQTLVDLLAVCRNDRERTAEVIRFLKNVPNSEDQIKGAARDILNEYTFPASQRLLIERVNQEKLLSTAKALQEAMD